MTITGVHTLLYSSEPEALRSVLADVFGWDHVADGEDGSWLIFALPPAEMGIHPGDEPAHQISLMCDDLDATIADLKGKGVAFRGEPENVRWGVVTTIVLPGGVDLMLYEPRHATAI